MQDEESIKRKRLQQRIWLAFVAIFFSIALGFVPIHSAKGQNPRIVVSPDTIDFGRVRVGRIGDSSFLIQNTGHVTFDALTLTHLDSNYLTGTDFTSTQVGNGSASLTLNPQNNDSVRDTISFQPASTGFQLGRISIIWADTTDTFYTPVVVIEGTGVAPNVLSNGYAFGDARVGDTSTGQTLWIFNNGSDSTAIDTVTILDSTALMDFSVVFDTLLPIGNGMTALGIGYEHPDSAYSFSVQFHPQSLGNQMLVIRIHTIDGLALYDTISGRGVEPFIAIAPTVIDFGTINVLPNSPSNQTKDTTFVVENSGNFAGILDSLVSTDDSNFSVLLNNESSLGETLDMGGTLTGSVTFPITKEGDFVDTISITNDTRYALYGFDSSFQPTVIVKVKVRSGPIGPDSISFGTITNCDTVFDTAYITNPYPIEVHVDTIEYVSNSAGFAYQPNFRFPINVPPNASYSLYVNYAFPPDSGNGSQQVKAALYQKQPDNEPAIVDTLTASLLRNGSTLSLQPILPTFASSAADIDEMKLPIMIQGPRNGISDLDSWTYSLTFSNDLFMPTVADTTGSLSVAGDSGYTFTTHWDQPSRTFTIFATGTAVSDSIQYPNNLLVTLYLQAYLTDDTAVTVTPEFTWTHHPCAYGLQSFTIPISYADDCGDPTIRAFLEDNTQIVSFTSLGPNPVNSGSSVSIRYRAAEASTIQCIVYDEDGEERGSEEISVNTGTGVISLPGSVFSESGPAFIRLSAISADGIQSVNQTCKILVIP